MPEKNLDTLLSSMNPHIHAEEFVFCNVSETKFRSLNIAPLCLFREDEGVSLIVQRSIADRLSLQYVGSWSLITCRVNSDLSALGFLAAMTKSLADAGIAVNAVSAYSHDHLFVPSDRKNEALLVLRQLSTVSRIGSAPTN